MYIYTFLVASINLQDQNIDHSKKKSNSRAKETKKTLRLKLTERYSTGVVGCSLSIGERKVTFKFSTEYDRPKEIFQNIVSQLHNYMYRCTCNYMHIPSTH